MKQSLEIFGVDINTLNKHWCTTYSNLLHFLSKLDMRDTVHLLNCPIIDDDITNEAVTLINRLFIDNSFLIEGYTLHEVSKWFLWYCHDWHEKNTKVQKQVKLDKIEQLKKEIKELEKGIK